MIHKLFQETECNTVKGRHCTWWTNSSFKMMLAFPEIQTHFDSSAADDYWKHCGTSRTFSKWAASPLSTIYLTLFNNYIFISRYFPYLCRWCFLLQICGKYFSSDVGKEPKITLSSILLQNLSKIWMKYRFFFFRIKLTYYIEGINLWKFKNEYLQHIWRKHTIEYGQPGTTVGHADRISHKACVPSCIFFSGILDRQILRIIYRFEDSRLL